MLLETHFIDPLELLAQVKVMPQSPNIGASELNSPPEDALLTTLRAAVGLLELPATDRLGQDFRTIASQSGQANFRIVVFAPFNYGKSTLLNALLGERALPIDLIPTTGAAIVVKYGEALASRIDLANGNSIDEAGTEILKQFAILDGDRRMREDVTGVEVFCPHPFLQTGVELVDLPGTDDQEAQDALVKQQLLTADLVIQVLDGRKLMTLGEREQLRDWLQDRGIETVVFVVNFLNLLEPEEQKQVYNRLRFVAESFRSKLPAGVSNLYRVDALPALRARLKGDMAAAQAAGLPILESALQTIVQGQQTQVESRRSRLQAIGQQVAQALQGKVEQLAAELQQTAGKEQQKAAIQQQAATLIRKGFTQATNDFADWLSLTHLLVTYQEEAAQALQQGQFRSWASGAFKQTAIDHQQAIAKWVHQACDFFEQERPHQLLVNFPPDPAIVPPPPPPPPNAPQKSSDLPTEALAGGALGWMLGGPVGAVIAGGASYLLNKTLNPNPAAEPTPVADPTPAVPAYACLEAAREYLIHFSHLNLASLQKYVTVGDRLIQAPATPAHRTTAAKQYQLQLLRSTLEQLQCELSSPNITES